MQSITSQEVAGIEARFERLRDEWIEETELLSSTTAIATHPAYQQIIGLGPPAVPLILRELERAPRQWFWALKAITGADPVPAESRGRVDEMAAAWIRWGKERGLVP